MASSSAAEDVLARAMQTMQKLDVDLVSADMRRNSSLGDGSDLTSFEQAGLTAREMYGAGEGGDDASRTSAEARAAMEKATKAAAAATEVLYDSKCDEGAAVATGK